MLPNPADQGGLVLLDEIGGQGVSFEIAVGRNGKVWVDSKSLKGTLAIGKAIQDTDAAKSACELTPSGQPSLRFVWAHL